MLELEFPLPLILSLLDFEFILSHFGTSNSEMSLPFLSTQISGRARQGGEAHSTSPPHITLRPKRCLFSSVSISPLSLSSPGLAVITLDVVRLLPEPTPFVRHRPLGTCSEIRFVLSVVVLR